MSATLNHASIAHPLSVLIFMGSLVCCFYDGNEPFVFGFLSPDLVVGGVQVIPAFRFRRTSALLGSSIACRETDNNEDWDWYYVNM
ncbi:hypothetical protein AZE42_10225 [Rhizopogon vesiculosus]|uniref:Uncharacterized protein n=1 Tax=Rhizopogon vesiculosus TaxID=180088 RepID=A0A1J8R655_9AGAM|nr:hypothetical protein AZE42_10225 [Rhizopogon vesiculosus]